MAINKIVAPLATAPNVFAAPVINHLNAHAINVNPIIKIANGYVKKGAMFCIGGELFAADADTAILGSNAGAIAVRFVVSGTTATATYVDSVSGLTWNGAYHGWYDGSGYYYERLWFIGLNNYDAYPIPGNSVSFGVTLPDSSVGLVDGQVVAYVKSSIEGTVGIGVPLPYISTEQNFTYTVEKFNGSTYDTIHTRTQSSSSGPTAIYVQYGEIYKFTMTRHSGLNLYIRYLGFIGSDPNALRL